MENRTCIITGANSGIGKVTATSLAQQGAILVMVCRSKEKGLIVLNRIKEKTRNPHIELIMADFSSQKDIRRAANEIKAHYPVIDVLINNAGAINDQRTETIDGYETTFATNHLGYFLFTNLLLDNLKAAPKARIVNVASEAQRMGKINFDDLQTKNGYTPMKAYSQSKLANIIFTFELAKRLKGTNITANCLHPGVVNTNFGKELKGFTGILFKLFSPFMRNADKGAETSIWLTTAPELEGISGKYYSNKKEIKSQPASYDAGIQKKLWEISEQMTNVK
jgi:Dehydrogenases with different specificities (related to short-chain alcohol dehydrogenases)